MMADFKELIEISLLGFNLPFTILLLLAVLYWLSVIFGALDIELFSIDLDIDGDGTADIDFDVDADMSGGSGFHDFLFFFNLGTVPLTVWLTVMLLAMWILSVTETLFLNPDASLKIAAAFLIPNLILGTFCTKLATAPLKKMFAVKKGLSRKEVVGKEGVVTSSTVTKEFGWIEVKTEGAPLSLNARSQKGPISKGCRVVVTQQLDEGVFAVKAI